MAPALRTAIIMMLTRMLIDFEGSWDYAGDKDSDFGWGSCNKLILHEEDRQYIEFLPSAMLTTKVLTANSAQNAPEFVTTFLF